MEDKMIDMKVSEEAPAIGEEQLKKFTKVLLEYKAGKAKTDARIISSENWWKLRNTREEKKDTDIGKDGGFTSVSGWLHNVIASKHADATAAIPEPNIRPREQADQQEAKILSEIIPCILEHNRFDEVYSDVAWQKLKTGTGLYKVTWDQNMLGGMGDIRVERANLLNVFWEPGVTDIQKSRYFFQTELVSKEVLREQFPQLEGKLKGNSLISSQFAYDDTMNTGEKATVIEVYYHKGGKLHYCKYVEDQVLYATENMVEPGYGMMGEQKPSLAEAGLYDHGMYPYVFDALFPIEGSPCGYGFVDLCRNPQTEIDLMKTAIVKNVMAGSIPRFFSQSDGNINEKEFLDLANPIVHVQGAVDEASLRQIPHNRLDGMYITAMDRTIEELRHTSGNTEMANGATSGGVTAASAIAALQEASGKGSRDSTEGSYRAYQKIIELCIELIRQFYDLPRQFRIVGQYGVDQFVTYTNQRLKLQPQGMAFGQDMGYRKPVFDIKVSAQKRNVYTKVSQNELALQLFQMGMFNPQMTDQALACIGMMDFEDKDELMQTIARNGTMQNKLFQYMQLAMMLAQVCKPDIIPQIQMDMQSVGMQLPSGSGDASMPQSDAIAGLDMGEPSNVEQARARANNASQPGSGGVTGGQ